MLKPIIKTPISPVKRPMSPFGNGGRPTPPILGKPGSKFAPKLGALKEEGGELEAKAEAKAPETAAPAEVKPVVEPVKAPKAEEIKEELEEMTSDAPENDHDSDKITSSEGCQDDPVIDTSEDDPEEPLDGPEKPKEESKEEIKEEPKEEVKEEPKKSKKKSSNKSKKAKEESEDKAEKSEDEEEEEKSSPKAAAVTPEYTTIKIPHNTSDLKTLLEVTNTRVVDPEWEEFVESTTEEEKQIVIGFDMDKVAINKEVSKLNVLRERIWLVNCKINAQLSILSNKDCEGQIERIKAVNLVGANDNERKKNAVLAVMNYVCEDGSIVNLYELYDELKARAAYLNGLMKQIESKHNSIVAILGSKKITD